MKILGTGLLGLVGSRIVEVLGDKYEFETSEVEITDKEKITKHIESSDASIVLHMAARADVDGCELDKNEDIKILGYKDIKKQKREWLEKKTAWGVNVLGTRNVAEACLATNKKLIYISTDFVFDGSKTDGYTEEDIPNPINWYAKTKYEGEKIVQSLKTSWAIIRIAFPYRASFQRNDFARAILSVLKNGKEMFVVSDQIFTPTFIDDIAAAIDTLIKNNANGIFHVVGSQSLTPHDAAILIAKVFNLDSSKIGKTTRAEFFKNRAPRPFQLALKNDKIAKLGIRMRTFEEGVKEIKRQLSS